MIVFSFIVFIFVYFLMGIIIGIVMTDDLRSNYRNKESVHKANLIVFGCTVLWPAFAYVYFNKGIKYCFSFLKEVINSEKNV